jgi:hypothetical protein
VLVGEAGALHCLHEDVAAEEASSYGEAEARVTALLTVDISKQPKLKALRSRLSVQICRGDHSGASLTADLILDLIGLRPFKLEDHA